MESRSPCNRRAARRDRSRRRRQDHAVQPRLRGRFVPPGVPSCSTGGTSPPTPVARRARGGLGRTFQTSSLFPQLTAVENVRLAAQPRLGRSLSVVRFPRRNDTATATARRCLAEVGLADRAEVAAGGLSHGDKRKLEIAVLLATEPERRAPRRADGGRVLRPTCPSSTEVIRALHRWADCPRRRAPHRCRAGPRRPGRGHAPRRAAGL